MSVWLGAASLLVLVVVAPLTVWIERRVKAWFQLRRGPSIIQPYRDFRKLFAKIPLFPNTATRFFLWAPWVQVAAVTAALTLLPVFEARPLVAGPTMLVLALLFTMQRFVAAAQAYDTGTPFGGLGSSRELFLGGLGEPVLLLVAAGIFLITDSAQVPVATLTWTGPASWLLMAAVVFAWLAEAARVPFDNPATHLELTMVHEALLLEASGWLLAMNDLVAMIKQTILATLLVLIAVPLPDAGATRVAAIVGGILVLSGLLAILESAVAKVRLFRASHLLVMGSLLAFLAGVVTFLAGGTA